MRTGRWTNFFPDWPLLWVGLASAGALFFHSQAKRKGREAWLGKDLQFDLYYVAYLKDDPAKEPIATSSSAPGVLAEAAHRTGRAKADFELREIAKEEYERLRRLLQL